MDHATLVILGKIGLALLCAGGGICAIFIGKRLYLYGVGLSPDGSKIRAENESFKIDLSLKTTGGIVMATSVAWAFIGYLASPTLKDGPVTVASFHQDLARIESRQLALKDDIPLEATKLTLSEKELRALGTSIKESAETITRSPDLNRNPEIKVRLAEIKSEHEQLEASYSAARSFSLTRNPDLLIKLIPLGQDLAVGIISGTDAPKVYRKAEAAEFLQDAGEALKEGTPKRIHYGSPNALTFDCTGPPGLCGSLEFDESGGGSAAIQWHLNPNRGDFDQLLASLDRRNLSASIQAVTISVCAWYEINVKRSSFLGRSLMDTLSRRGLVTPFINHNASRSPNLFPEAGGWHRH